MDCPFPNFTVKGKVIKMRTIIVNGTEYKARPFDFNTVCDLEDLGFRIEDMGSKNMSMMRAYVGLCMGMNRDAAGKEMEAHFINGGKMDDIISVMNAEMEESDFFRALQENAEEEVGKSSEEETTKKRTAGRSTAKK